MRWVRCLSKSLAQALALAANGARVHGVAVRGHQRTFEQSGNLVRRFQGSRGQFCAVFHWYFGEDT
jgi:hypothetical protein